MAASSPFTILSTALSSCCSSPAFDLSRISFAFHFHNHSPVLSSRARFSTVSRPTVSTNVRCLSNSVNPPVAMEQVVAALEQVKLLTSVNDQHGGVIVELSEPIDPGLFASMLRLSISEWRKLGKKGVWIKLPIELCSLVEVAVRVNWISFHDPVIMTEKLRYNRVVEVVLDMLYGLLTENLLFNEQEGFWYHHAEPTYLMLVSWLPGGVHPLPPNASHRVSVGAFVMNENREVLVVQENSGVFRGTGIWKFPTGVVEEGEDLCTAVVREVKEETAIDAEFMEILAFRQSHKAYFEKSDLFFLCMLRPISFDVQRQEAEIEAAKWMPWDEYVAQPFVQNTGFVKHISDICLAKVDGDYTGFSAIPTSSGGQMGCVYQNAQGLRR
ncbi:unnamed protein product [Linum tenue]|uniref:Nudix hydrolase domain-containing protein n=1 Tax=Linum tenue TaxID=586396 RepID=A0AAV0M2J0_9ROSI|nr:unnamed protein product [Linum tenue]